MKASTMYSDAAIRLDNSLTSAVRYFRRCEDIRGLECFLNGIEDIVITIDLRKYYRKSNSEIEEINRLLINIIEIMENRDITGLADIIEFELYPLTKALTGGVI